MFYIYLHLVLCDMVEQAVLVVAAVQQEVAANLPLIHVLIPTQNMYRCEIWQCGGAGAFLLSVVNPDPVGSVPFSWILIRNYLCRIKATKKKVNHQILLLFCFNCSEKCSFNVIAVG